MNGTELRSFSHFQILPEPHTWSLAETFKMTDFEAFLQSL